MEQAHGDHDSHQARIVLEGPTTHKAAGHLGTRLWNRVRAAVVEWASATIHVMRMRDVAEVFTEQVLAQLPAHTQGVLPGEADIYCMAAPMGRFWRQKKSTLQAG